MKGIGKHNRVKNPNWLEADQLAIYKHDREVQTRVYREWHPGPTYIAVENAASSDLNSDAVECNEYFNFET